MAANKIIIEIRGGVVQSVYADNDLLVLCPDLKVDILDWDNGEENLEDEKNCKELEKETKNMIEVLFKKGN